MKKSPGDFIHSIKNFLVPQEEQIGRQVTNNYLLEELLACFNHSCKTESVGNSLLFNMHFLVILQPDVYEQRLPSLPVVVKEAVKLFYRQIASSRNQYEEIAPVSSLWQFKFGPATEFYGELLTANDVKVIGMLTGPKVSTGVPEPRGSNKVTMKSKATNVFDKMDLNMDVLRHIQFAENGHFSIRFNPELSLGHASPAIKKTQSREEGFARIEYFLGDKNKAGSYVMRDTEMVIARREPDNQGYTNYLLIDSPYVSHPHARIRLNETTGRCQIASFSAHETRVNEKVIVRSNAEQPQWVNLEANSQILLNGIITLNFIQH